MDDRYMHVTSDVFYVVENVLGPAESSAEYERLKNNFDSQLLDHCNCDKVCSDMCKCHQRSSGVNYTYYWHDGLVKYKLNHRAETFPIFECNEFCSCSNDCGNRIVQKGPIDGLVIKQCDKGLGLYTKCFIPKETFVCEYAGELITKSQAAIRHQANVRDGKMNYIFCLREHSSDSVVETFVDPSVFGNIGRYLNHSCEPNCYIVPMRCESAVPKLAIFSCVDILANKELTFHYGSNNISDSQSMVNRVPCLCKSENCSGFMPFHDY